MAKLLVLLREIIEPQTVEFRPEDNAIRRSRMAYQILEADLVALETALDLSEGKPVDVIGLVAPGREGLLDEPMALAAGEVRLVWAGADRSDLASAAGSIVGAVQAMPEHPNLILAGVDEATGLGDALAAMVAARLDWPFAGHVLEIGSLAEQPVLVERRWKPGYRERLDVHLPAVVALVAKRAARRQASWPDYVNARARRIAISEVGSALLEPAPTLLETLGIGLPRPFPRHLPEPDQSLAPHERIGAILDAGVQRRQGEMVRGTPEELAQRAVQFLLEREFI